ncbi:hypothetical protein GGS20DRAFT_554953 [Poronia punctata]|nr:hypothetical protein GGS20DRAFT_554953 [Poronia punctata]
MAESTSLAELRQWVLDNIHSKEQMRYVKILISEMMSVDFIRDLPVEVVALIAVQLDFADYGCCLRVSKSWREMLMADTVLTSYAKTHWPALVTFPVTRDGFREALAKIGWAIYFRGRRRDDGDLAQCKSEKFIRWDSLAEIELDPALHGPGAFSLGYLEYTIDLYNPERYGIPTALFACGKVAYHLYDHVLVVDDLRQQKRKIFTPANAVVHGPRITLQALGSRLVVCSIGRLMIAWDHISNAVDQISLPTQCHRCTTHGDRVAMVLFGGVVLLWTWGQGLVELDTASARARVPANGWNMISWLDSMKPFFDHRDNRTLFLASRLPSRNLNEEDFTRNRIRPTAVYFTVSEFAGDKFINGWTSDEIKLNEPVPMGATGKYQVRAWEYECEQAWICFYIPCTGESDAPLVVFCKLQRRFFYFQKEKARNVDGKGIDRLLPTAIDCDPDGVMDSGYDLDFLVRFWQDGYNFWPIEGRRQKHFEPIED